MTLLPDPTLPHLRTRIRLVIESTMSSRRHAMSDVGVSKEAGAKDVEGACTAAALPCREKAWHRRLPE